MRVAHFEQVFGSLQRAQVRFLVVGGVAVVAHGVVRYTNDLDLVFAFDEDNLRKGVQTLEELGFKAGIPITAAAFADPENRRRWAQEKNMLVFQMALFAEDDLPIDIFIEPPFDFEQEYVNAVRCELAPDLFVPVVSVDRLIAMKRLAGRSRDLEDVANLERLRSKKP
jgi:Nucleotidyl transferase AbiEii toxin, Type IV TA system